MDHPDSAQNNLCFLLTVLGSLPHMVFIKDARRDFRFSFFNSAGYELLGVSESDIIGKNDFDFFPEKQARFFREKDESVFKQKSTLVINEEPLQTPRGERWLHTIKIPVFDPQGNPHLLVGISEDITERRQEKQSLELMAFASQLGLWDWDLNTDAVEFDERWCAILGYKKSELPQHLETWSKNTHPEDLKRTYVQIDDYLGGRIAEFESRIRMKHKAGHWVPILATGKVTGRDASGRPVRFAGTHFDLSNIVRGEENLKAMEEVVQRQSKLAKIGELAAGVGHEINNPLAIILGRIEQLEDKVSEGNFNPTLFMDNFQKQKKAAQRIRAIVDGLRTIARTGGSSNQRANAATAITDTCDLLKVIYAKEGVELNFTIPKGDFWTRGSAEKIQQVLINLISNAKDATDGKQERKIDVCLTPIGAGRLRFSVRDNGFGIPDESKNRIFDAFFTSKEIGKGTGLGLSISASIVEDLSGSIDFTTKEGEGSEFFFDLPLSTPPSEQDSTEADAVRGSFRPLGQGGTPKASALNTFRVAVVDDEEDLRDVLQEMLERLGCEVSTFPGAIETLDALTRERFDLIISDVKMPGMDGIALVKEIQTRYAKDLPEIFLCTGGVNKHEALKHIQVRGVLEKPFSREAVLTVVEIAKKHRCQTAAPGSARMGSS